MINDAKSFLFVCTGDTCRSPMAEYLFRFLQKEKDDFLIASAGIYAVEGASMSDQTMEVLSRLKNQSLSRSKLMEHKASRLDREHLEDVDCIFVMENFHKAFIEDLIPDRPLDIFLLSEFSQSGVRQIDDPIGASLETYFLVRDQIEECLRGIQDMMQK